jgi:hypothetical protein
VHEAAGNQQAAAHAAGEVVDLRVAPVREVRDLERTFDGGLALVARHAVQVREHAQVLLDRERDVEVVELRHDAAQRACLFAAGRHREAEDLDLPLVRDGLRREQAHGRRLAGAVGAEQSDARAVGDLEVEVIDGRQVAETLDDATQAKGGHPAQVVTRLCAVRYGQPP